jgi:hypothetical protein
MNKLTSVELTDAQIELIQEALYVYGKSQGCFIPSVLIETVLQFNMLIEPQESPEYEHTDNIDDKKGL